MEAIEECGKDEDDGEDGEDTENKDTADNIREQIEIPEGVEKELFMEVRDMLSNLRPDSFQVCLV